MRILVLLSAFLFSGAASRAQDGALVFQAEDAELTGVVTSNARSGYQGTGYVTGFDATTDTLTFRVTADGAFYQLRLGLANDDYDFRQVGVSIDGAPTETVDLYLSPEFQEILVTERRLAAGEHTVAITGIGIEVDYLAASAREPYAPPAAPPPVLADPAATDAARSLFAFLLDVYGEKVLAGQQDVYQNGAPRTAEIDYVEGVTGKRPAVGAFDLINYSPSRRQYGTNPSGWAEEWIEWAGDDGIVTLMWHWNAPTDLLNTGSQPWWRGFYTEATTFDVEAALAEGPGGERYDLLLRDIDAIAAELQKFEDADVPVLWRPLHEAYGGWFWWGAKGPGPYVALWRLMFDRLVGHHGLHNLIWVHTHRPTDADQAAWYPGDDYVDVVGADMYVDDPDSIFPGQWSLLQEQFGANKLVALTESGTLPDMARSADFGVTWSWFVIWEGGFIRDLDTERLVDVYTSDVVLTRDELPDWRSYTLATAAAPAPQEAGALSLSPNPTAGRSTLRLDLSEPADIRVDVFDLTGRLVARQSLGARPAGALMVPVEAPDTSGVYLVRVTAGNRVARGTLTVVR